MSRIDVKRTLRMATLDVAIGRTAALKGWRRQRLAGISHRAAIVLLGTFSERETDINGQGGARARRTVSDP
jgi:hypothetical protein